MTVHLVNLGVNINPGTIAELPFYNVFISSTTPVDIGEGWTLNYIAGFAPAFDSHAFDAVTTSGNAAWANQVNVVNSGHRPGAGGAKLLLKGDPNTQIVVDVYSNGIAGRIITWDLNGGTPQSIETDTLTETITLTGSTDGSGEATLTYSDGGGATSGPYSNALRITTVEGPSVTLS